MKLNALNGVSFQAKKPQGPKSHVTERSLLPPVTESALRRIARVSASKCRGPVIDHYKKVLSPVK